jgi:hypothetical protein
MACAALAAKQSAAMDKQEEMRMRRVLAWIVMCS